MKGNRMLAVAVILMTALPSAARATGPGTEPPPPQRTAAPTSSLSPSNGGAVGGIGAGRWFGQGA
jgi:hypothetical protein